MDAAEYKHVVLGLIFLKYVSDSFEEKYRQLLAEGYGDEEDRDEYLAENKGRCCRMYCCNARPAFLFYRHSCFFVDFAKRKRSVFQRKSFVYG